MWRRWGGGQAAVLKPRGYRLGVETFMRLEHVRRPVGGHGGFLPSPQHACPAGSC